MSGQNLLSQLLGLNQDTAQGSHGGGQGKFQANQSVQGHNRTTRPSPGGGWNSALQNLKLSDAFQGINVTPNFLFLLLFVGLTAWLAVVYYIRHNEPLANSVLGTPAAGSATAAADRQLVAGLKKTLPVRTSPTSGEFYVPIPHQGRILHSGQFGYPSNHYTQSGLHSSSAAMAISPNSALPLPSPPLPPAPSPHPQPTPLDGYSGYHSAPQHPYLAPHNNTYIPPDTSRHAYMVPVHAAAGTRVKMIVNR